MIIYFSGNGNSQAIAVALSGHLNTSLVQLRGHILLDPESNPLTIQDGEQVIWVFPVYSWGMPPVINEYIKRCSINSGESNNHYLVLTCGDDCGLTARQWKRAITHREWNACGTASVFMPNTYVLMKGFDIDSKQAEAKKLNDSHERVKEIAHLIHEQFDSDDTFHGRFAWIKSKIIYPWFIRYAMSPKPFHTTDACTGCGKCARNCPTDNITMIKGKPAWADKCAMCLSCYHKCPHHAVAYGKATSDKGQYTCPST